MPRHVTAPPRQPTWHEGKGVRVCVGKSVIGSESCWNGVVPEGGPVLGKHSMFGEIRGPCHGLGDTALPSLRGDR